MWSTVYFIFILFSQKSGTASQCDTNMQKKILLSIFTLITLPVTEHNLYYCNVLESESCDYHYFILLLVIFLVLFLLPTYSPLP